MRGFALTDYSARLRSLVSEPSSDAADDGPRRRRVRFTRDEMMDQGAALMRTVEREREACAALGRLAAERRIARIVVAGCGDSWFAAMGARLAMELCTGLPVEPVQAFDWAHYAAHTADARTMVIGLSSGGGTPAVLAALDAARRQGALAIGLSNTAGAPVVTRYDGGLAVHATRRGWPTQSSTAAMGLLIAFAAAIGRAMNRGAAEIDAITEELAVVAAAMDTIARDLDPAARRFAGEVAALPIVLFTGAGPCFAAAAFGAAKVKELSPIHAVAIPLEEYHHYRSQKQGDPLIMVATDGAARERALDTALVSAHVGGRTVALLAADDREISGRIDAAWMLPAASAALAALPACVPMHLFAYHFAEARFELGLGYGDAPPRAIAS
jgi:glutamine---fructose-6-phosphate transaminase (isomerizing)